MSHPRRFHARLLRLQSFGSSIILYSRHTAQNKDYYIPCTECTCRAGYIDLYRMCWCVAKDGGRRNRKWKQIGKRAPTCIVIRYPVEQDLSDHHNRWIHCHWVTDHPYPVGLIDLISLTSHRLRFVHSNHNGSRTTRLMEPYEPTPLVAQNQKINIENKGRPNNGSIVLNTRYCSPLLCYSHTLSHYPTLVYKALSVVFE